MGYLLTNISVCHLIWKLHMLLEKTVLCLAKAKMFVCIIYSFSACFTKINDYMELSAMKLLESCQNGLAGLPCN